jgi:ArsR family transcriptional regulator
MASVALDRTLLDEVDADEACLTGPSTVMPAAPAARLARIFKALSDPTRVRLLAHICSSEHGTACACHLPQTLGISQPTLSHHLRTMVDAGLITREQRGRWAHYTAVPEVLEVVQDFLGGSITAARCC